MGRQEEDNMGRLEEENMGRQEEDNWPEGKVTSSQPPWSAS